MIHTEILIDKALQKYFGYNNFRSGQEECINSILNGKNVIAVMPTGGGKSLCYQLPAIIMEGTALVISPLIALMKDQVDTLSKINISATYINSSLTYPEIQQRLEGAYSGLYKILYVAPERLESNSFLESLKRIKISFLAVDEAHCISEWGHDFRPSYLAISKIFDKIDISSISAFTATATPEVQEDIIKSLKMKNVMRVVKGFDRPNLNYKVLPTEEKLQDLIQICQNHRDGSIIIYCGSRKRVENYAEGLQDNKIQAEIYHAGLPTQMRKFVQDKFIHGKSKIILATNAFGMGIDKADVRAVVHCDLTQTLEAYYQEAGRAGRDGKPSDCILLYHPSDRNLQEFFINTTYPPIENIETVYNTLFDLNQTRLGAKPLTPIYLDDVEIGNRANLSARIVTSVMNLLERYDILQRNSGQSYAKIKFTVPRERLIEYFNNTTEDRREVLESLLRSVSSEALNAEVELDLNNLIQKYNLKSDKVLKALQAYEYARLIKYQPAGAAGGIILKSERMPFQNLPIDFEAYKERKRFAYKKLDLVQRYAETYDCKRNFILEYFRETDIDGTCGRCSSCHLPEEKPVKQDMKLKKLLEIILSAAVVLDGRFGKKLMIDYLSGINNPKIIEYRFNNSKFYASAKSFNQIDIEQEIDYAVHNGFLKLSADIYSTISITQKGKELIPEIPEPFLIERNLPPDNDSLYRKLIDLRHEVASREKIVARAIAGDSALRKISQTMPRTIAELEDIPGIGPIFISRYGELFLQKVKEAFDLIHESEKIPEPVSEEITQIKLYLLENLSLQEISKKMKKTEGEISKLIQDAIVNGVQFENLHIHPLLVAQLKSILTKNRNATLREIRAQLDMDIDYPILRIAVALARK